MAFEIRFHQVLAIGLRRRLRGVAFLMLLGLQPVLALIVVDGKAVSHWPKGTFQTPGGTSALGKTSGQVVHYFPNPSGKVLGLTLLVDFSDQPAKYTTAQINDWLNLPGYSLYGCQGSVRDYWADVSNGKVDLQNEIHGYYRAKNPKSYYEAASDFSRAKELLIEVIDHFDATVDFSKFDNDNDGRTEAISIAYAGPQGTFSQGLWPHASGIRNQTRDGVILSKYMMTNLGTTLSLMTFCHEVGHMVFGWPDLYGFGDYCLMGNAGTLNPVPVNDFYRADQGWIDIVDIDKNVNAFFKAPANSKSGFRYLNPNRPGECYFWSNWKNVGRRSEIEGSGILMLHFDSEIPKNNPPSTLGLTVVQADGKWDLNKTTWPEPGTDPFDFYSMTTRATFGPTTVPSSKWNDNMASGLLIHDISPIRDTMTFYVGTSLANAQSVRKGTGVAPVKVFGTEQFDIQGRDQEVRHREAGAEAAPAPLHTPVIWRASR